MNAEVITYINGVSLAQWWLAAALVFLAGMAVTVVVLFLIDRYVA